MKFWNLLIVASELAHNIPNKSFQRLVVLALVWVRHTCLHLFTLEFDAIAEHSDGQVLIKVRICSFRMLRFTGVRNVRRAVRFAKQVVLFLFNWLISSHVLI